MMLASEIVTLKFVTYVAIFNECTALTWIKSKPKNNLVGVQSERRAQEGDLCSDQMPSWISWSDESVTGSLQMGTWRWGMIGWLQSSKSSSIIMIIKSKIQKHFSWNCCYLMLTSISSFHCQPFNLTSCRTTSTFPAIASAATHKRWIPGGGKRRTVTDLLCSYCSFVFFVPTCSIHQTHQTLTDRDPWCNHAVGQACFRRLHQESTSRCTGEAEGQPQYFLWTKGFTLCDICGRKSLGTW